MGMKEQNHLFSGHLINFQMLILWANLGSLFSYVLFYHTESLSFLTREYLYSKLSVEVGDQIIYVLTFQNPNLLHSYIETALLLFHVQVSGYLIVDWKIFYLLEIQQLRYDLFEIGKMIPHNVTN